MFLDLLKQELGEPRFAEGEHRFNCPFCGESKHKLYVNDEKGLWTCFKCEERGNPVTFVMNYFNATFPEAVDILESYDHSVDKDNTNRNWNPTQHLTPEEELYLFIANRGVSPKEGLTTKFTCPNPPTNCRSLIQNFSNPEAYPFFQYLSNRGVTVRQIEDHHMSYVTHGTVQLESGKELTLVNHLVFYTFNEANKPIYWNTRSIEPHAFIKSFNAPSREGEYSKNNTVFNLNHVYKTDCVVICEGVFNALTVGTAGVATFGKKVTREQIQLILSQTHNVPIYLFLDTDAWREMIDSAKRIKSIDPSRQVYFVYSGTDEDANDLGTEKCWELIRQAIPANSEGELKLRLLNM
jgi:DNA primase